MKSQATSARMVFYAAEHFGEINCEIDSQHSRIVVREKERDSERAKERKKEREERERERRERGGIKEEARKRINL